MDCRITFVKVILLDLCFWIDSKVYEKCSFGQKIIGLNFLKNS